FSGASGSTTLTVNQATPTLSWPSPAAITYGTALGATQLDASASAVVNGSTVSVAGTFSYTLADRTTPAPGAVPGVRANQTLLVSFTPTLPDALPSASGSTTRTAVGGGNQATPTLSWPSPAAITYGTALGSAQLDASASAVVSGSTVSVAGTF